MQIVTREQAKISGLKKFFTGNPCSKGHVCERLVSNGQCVQCKAKQREPDKQKQYNIEYRDKNREKIKAYDRQRRSGPEFAALRRLRYRKKKEQFVGPLKPRLKQPEHIKKEKRAASFRSYYDRNKERLLQAKKEYVANNRESYLEAQRQWRLKNVSRRTALQAKRDAKLRQILPPWFSELDDFIWKEAFNLASTRKIQTGIDWEVDHMIPVQAEKATGLHVGLNCQVIPKYLNQAKSNKMVMTEPLEWIRNL